MTSVTQVTPLDLGLGLGKFIEMKLNEGSVIIHP
tara:strand:+ start:329 stop:430 length:102 start_codon:yes stop_codon:yes gene_type:complete